MVTVPVGELRSSRLPPCRADCQPDLRGSEGTASRTTRSACLVPQHIAIPPGSDVGSTHAASSVNAVRCPTYGSAKSVEPDGGRGQQHDGTPFGSGALDIGCPPGEAEAEPLTDAPGLPMGR
jgi:hypothetical protein